MYTQMQMSLKTKGIGSTATGITSDSELPDV